MSISNTDPTIDTLDVLTRIDALSLLRVQDSRRVDHIRRLAEGERSDEVIALMHRVERRWSESREGRELAALSTLMRLLASSHVRPEGALLIRDARFSGYIVGLLDAISPNLPIDHVDAVKVARDHYDKVYFDGVAYLVKHDG